MRTNLEKWHAIYYLATLVAAFRIMKPKEPQLTQIETYVKLSKLRDIKHQDRLLALLALSTPVGAGIGYRISLNMRDNLVTLRLG